MEFLIKVRVTAHVFHDFQPFPITYTSSPMAYTSSTDVVYGRYSRPRLRAGMSIVEVMIALGLLATVIATLMGSLGSAAGLNGSADLRERAVAAGQRRIEQIQAANNLYTIYQTYSAGTFDVPGLSPPAGRAHVGQTTIPSYYAQNTTTTTPGPMPVLIEIRWRASTSDDDMFAISYIAVPR